MRVSNSPRFIHRIALAVSLAVLVPMSPAHAVDTTTAYTLAQVAAHNSAANCWSVVNGNVYNLTSWIARHPGGQSPIKGMCGVDASAAFNGQHSGTAAAKSMLASFQIGVLKASTTTTVTKKKTTIVCVKGSKKKSITSLAPKCPSGWKKLSAAKAAALKASKTSNASQLDKTNLPYGNDDDEVDDPRADS